MLVDNPFNEGRESQRMGEPKEANPYPVGSYDYKDWNNGYNAEADEGPSDLDEATY